MFVFVKLVQLKGLVTAYYPDFCICIFCVYLCLCNNICIRICLCSSLIFAFALCVLICIHYIHLLSVFVLALVLIFAFAYSYLKLVQVSEALVACSLYCCYPTMGLLQTTLQQNKTIRTNTNTTIQTYTKIITNTSDYTQTNINSYKHCRDHIKK